MGTTFPFSPVQIDAFSAWFQRYGVWPLLLAWGPFFGNPLALVAGFLRVHIVPFLVLATIGVLVTIGARRADSAIATPADI
jgi:membrane protein YqaA with SNARE-associated domain